MLGAVASQSVLLVTSMMAMTSICRFNTQVEAGGKGKGARPGHIIIQNELKGNGVPIYMPIPIPVPMPIVPATHPPSSVKVHHHHHNKNKNDDDDDDDSGGEVKKIYLIQPVPMAPQRHHYASNMKGGGFMGPPVQNNIHLGHLAPKYHRHAPTSQHDDSSRSATKSTPVASPEVKILPIVMIPPVAPVPPVQTTQLSSHAPRLTLSPHFNNYLVSSSSRDRHKPNLSGQRTHRGQTVIESFNEYGGSVGGTVFKNRFAARSRPNNQGRGRIRIPLSPVDYQEDQMRHQARDIDYGDYDSPPDDLDSGSASSWPNGQGRASRQQLRRRQQAPVSMNSINDIIDAYNRQQTGNNFVELAGEAQQPGEFTAAQLRLTKVHRRPMRPVNSFDSAASSSVQRNLASESPTLEISLDELAALNREIRQDLFIPQQQQARDLSPLYYDRNESYHSSGRRPIRPTNEERDHYDEDEWRFDSIKSVSHAAPANKSFPTGANSTTTTDATGTRTTTVSKIN